MSRYSAYMAALMLCSLVGIAGAAPPYSVRWSTPPNPPSESTWQPNFVDLNQDGLPETYSLSRDFRGLSTLEIRSAGDYSLIYSSPNSHRFDYSVGPISVFTWNIDGDPMPELVITGVDALTYLGAMRVYEWGGSNYQLKWQRTDLPSQFALSGADLDGDLAPEITLTALGGCDVDILNGSTGATVWTFNYPSHINPCTGMPSIGFSDVNANGVLELVIIDASSNGWVIESPANVLAVEGQGPFRQSALTVGAPTPNPANGDATVAFELAQPGLVEIDVLDAAGRRVRQVARAPYAAGAHATRWDGQDSAGRAAPAGLYWIEVRTGPERLSRRMVRIR